MKQDCGPLRELASNLKLSVAIGLWAVIGLAGAVFRWSPRVIHEVATRFKGPHSSYYLWNSQFLALHVFSDSVIFLSYLAITVSLGLLLYRLRREVAFAWIFVILAIFMLSCGFAYAMDVVVLWRPLYWLAGDTKLITALASLTTALSLPFLFPDVKRLLSSAKASRQNASRFLAMVNGGNDAFYLLESVRNAAGDILDFRFTFLNVKGEQLIFGAPGSVQGQLLCRRHPVIRSDGFFEQLARVVETGESLDLRTQIADPTIKASWLHLLVIKVDDGIALTARNISTQKKRELALAETNAQFQSLVEGVRDHALFTIDGEGIVTTWNLGAERLLGYSKSEIVGQHFSCFLTKEERNLDLAGGLLPLVLVEGLATDEGWRVTADGDRFFAHVDITHFLVDQEIHRDFAVMVQDVTARRVNEIAHQQLKQERVLLHDTFLSHISHELRTPLTATYFFTTNVLDGLLGDLTPEQHEHLSLAMHNLNQLKDMVGDLLDVTSAETHKLRLVPQRLSPGALIGDVLATCRPDAVSAGVGLTSVIHPDLCFVWADPVRARQILTNIIDNAVRFTPPNGKVSVACDGLVEENNFVRFSVTDSGCGISPANLEIIFDRLVQIDNGIVSSRAGLGLGLFITRELVQQHGGRIWVESQAGLGSAFFFTLPAFSPAKLFAPVLAELDAGATLTLVTVEVASIHDGVAPDVLLEVRNVLNRLVRNGQHFLSPSMCGRDKEETFFILSYASPEGTATLTRSLDQELKKFSKSGIMPLIHASILPLHPGYRREQQATEIVAEIDRAVQLSMQKRVQVQ